MGDLSLLWAMYAIRYLYASGGGDALNLILLLTLLKKDNKQI